MINAVCKFMLWFMTLAGGFVVTFGLDLVLEFTYLEGSLLVVSLALSCRLLSRPSYIALRYVAFLS